MRSTKPPWATTRARRAGTIFEPWLGGIWSLRDIIDYQELAFESLLYNAAVHREEMLRNFYRIGQHQVERAAPWGIVDSSESARSRCGAPHAANPGVRCGRDHPEPRGR